VPELPEVETIRQELAKEVVGRKIKAVVVTNSKVLKRHKDTKSFGEQLEGRSIKSVARLGKYLVLGLDNLSHLVMDLGPTGQLHKAKSAKEVTEKHTHVVIVFTQGGELRFIDPKPLGDFFVSSPPPEGTKVDISATAQVAMGGEGNLLRAKVPELAHLGFDPVEDTMSWERFGVIIRHHKMEAKSLLLDQDIVSGMGNVYADEPLFAAGLRFDRATDSLSTTEVRRLWRSMVEILAEATKHNGSTLADGQFVDIFGKSGGFQNFFEVYERDGLACRRCRREISKVKHQNLTTYFCEHCQI
jgi:formamidopyrimidine-DNA glycosylase